MNWVTSKITTFSINVQVNELVKLTLSKKQILAEKQTKDDSIEMIDESAKGQDFLQDNNPSERKYTTKRIKSINFFVKYCLCWY